MIRKIIIAINNKKLEDKIKENDNIRIVCNNLQYREAILEILEKNKNIDYILINENLPGIISVEELIKKIKIINNKINIIFFLEKEDIDKINKLKKLNIENIFLNKKININKVLNLIIKNNNFNNLKINNKIEEKIINKKTNKSKNNTNLNKKYNRANKLITITGKRKSGKSTIISLLLIYLLEKKQKILLINLNKKIENNYLILFGKKYYKIKNKNSKANNKLNRNNIFLKSEIKINNNLIFIDDFQKIIQENNYNNILEYFNKYYIKKYDYILVDIGDNADRRIRQKITKISNKSIVVMNSKLLGIKEIRQLMQKSKLQTKEKKKSLHIILNKCYFSSISNSILKKLTKKKIEIDIIFYNRKLKNIQDKTLNDEKIKINLFLKNKLKNILE